MPTGPAGGPRGGARSGLADRIDRGSLFDRIDLNPRAGPDRRRTTRSESPDRLPRRSDVSGPPPENIDRYVPGERRRRSRSPLPARRGGRAPGVPRGRGGRGRGDRGDSRREGGPRPRKTADQLDAEMDDYWGSGAAGNTESTAATATASVNGGEAAAAETPIAGAVMADDDVDMIE